MKRRWNLFQVVQVFVLALVASASIAQVSLVADYTAHYGIIDGTDLTGYVTYDVYVSFPNSNYRLTSIGGGLQSNPNFTVQLSSDCDFFQHTNGSYFSGGINCADYASDPSLEWDSRFAVGSECNNASPSLYHVSSEMNALNNWENGNTTLALSNTLFFRMPNDPSVLLSSGNKILVGRFTTCGNLCVKMGVQYFENYSGAGSAFQTEVVEGCFNNPCITNPFAQTATVTQSGCTTESQEINLNAGGNVPVNYELWDTSINAVVATTNSLDGSCSFNAPSAGSFVIHSTDNFGCRDTTSVISVQEFIPPSVQLIGNNLTCFQDASGSIEISGSGGSGALTELSTSSLLPFTLMNLDAGIVNVQVIDENGCLASSSVLLEEPAVLQASLTQQTDLVCANQCTGAIAYSSAGGVGNYAFELVSNGSTGLASGTLTNLCGGADTLVISDGNGCAFQLPFELSYPDSLQIFSSGVGPTCSEYTDGEANLVFEGGTGALHITIAEGNYEILPQSLLEYQLANLGVGIISIQVEDDAGCSLNEIITVEPVFSSNLNLSASSTEESCFNNLDGTAEVLIEGGFGPFSFLWNDAQAQQTPLATGLAGNRNYRVQVTDVNNCVYTRTVFVPLKDGCIFIANAITPNGDGSNDTWVIGGLDGYSAAHVQVVNRYGQLVFESNGYANPWRGTLNNEPLPPADYYYVVSYDKSKEPLTGVVSIKYE
jgi:gliding motility-associated-like protein